MHAFTAENYGIYSHMPAGGASLNPLGRFAGKVSATLMVPFNTGEH